MASHTISTSVGIATSLSLLSVPASLTKKVIGPYLPSMVTMRNIQRLLTLLFIAAVVVNSVALSSTDVLSPVTLTSINISLLALPSLLALCGIRSSTHLFHTEYYAENKKLIANYIFTAGVLHTIYFLALGALMAMNALYLAGYFDQTAIAYSSLMTAAALTFLHGAKVYEWSRHIKNNTIQLIQWPQDNERYPMGIATCVEYHVLLSFPCTASPSEARIAEAKQFISYQAWRQFLMTLLFVAAVVVNAVAFIRPDLLSSDISICCNMGLLALPACVVFKGIWDTPSRFTEERVLHTIYFLALSALIAMNALGYFNHFNQDALVFSTTTAAALLAIFHAAKCVEWKWESVEQ